MKKILIVDDSPVLAKMSKVFLEKANFSVETRENGQDAIDALSEIQPDLILMDAEMPVMDGWEACESIKTNESSKHIPIIMCTGDDSPEYIEKATQLGAADYLTKPVKQDTMIEKVNKALSGE